MCSLRRWTLPFGAAVLLAALPALATTVQPPTAQEMIAALARANASVVGVRALVDEEARSAETLGQLRRGSGVVIAPDGLILTIGYLMLEAEQIEIVTQDNKTLPARAVAYDLATGFGLLQPVLPLRTSNGSVSVAVLGSSLPLQAGEALMAVTGPQASDDGEVSMTRLVSKRPFSGTWEYHIDMALFTSPPLLGNGANHSGAPLFNQKGELVGIGSLLVADASGQNRALPGNMFVPVDLLRPILAEMQRSGTSAQSRRPWLGLNSIDQGGRIQIVRVSKDSPAELAGLEAGDVVLAVDGTKVATLADFYKKLWDRATPDAEVALTVLQGADVKTIVLKAQDRLQTLKKPSGI
ncbi:S1C family serine protease [Polaromonas sp.]|jgi:serine protease Do|uniref:S1C family serine protease n=1 Tax=Polaromonas sp. TaxID=1869339 RepID=UPI0037C6B836